LRFDPVFWRSVNGATAGPFDFFALLPLGSICGADGYLSARLTALGLLAISLTLTHQCLALNFGRQLARFATLATTCFEALTFAGDFLHYSTELMPVAFVAGAAYAATRRWTLSGSWAWSGLGGVLLGAVPLAKVQAIPLALLAGLTWTFFEFKRSAPGNRRALVYLLLGAITPALLFATQLALAGEWQTFIMSYFVYNLNYVSATSDSLGEILQAVVDISLQLDSLLHIWVLGVGLWLLLMLRIKSCSDRHINYLALAAIIMVVVALCCVLTPRRPFLHYWQLIVVPVTLMLGAMSAKLVQSTPLTNRKKAHWVVALCALTLIGTMLGQRVFRTNPFLGTLAYTQKSRAALPFYVLKSSRPGELLAVWGWTNELYVETGLRQATRDSHIGPLFETGSMKNYFKQRYLADFVRNRPEVFVDSVGSHSLTFQSPAFRHERSFPALGAVVAADYTLISEIGDSRIYRRKELATR
jgi:hypothetical protein